MTRQVLYNGKPGKAADETLPVPPIPQPFHQGETRVFTDDYLRSLGVDPKDGDAWVDDTFAIQNQNRSDDDPLFVVTDAPREENDPDTTNDESLDDESDHEKE